MTKYTGTYYLHGKATQITIIRTVWRIYTFTYSLVSSGILKVLCIVYIIKANNLTIRDM